MNRFNCRGAQKPIEPEVDQATYHKFDGAVIVTDLFDMDQEQQDFPGKAWIMNKLERREAVGWDIEWQPDRKDSDNRVALMQFADDKTALLLRTNRVTVLPDIVIHFLTSDLVKKISVGYNGNDRSKMEKSFHRQPAGMEDLSDLARRKGHMEVGLKALGAKCGLKIKKDSAMARSNWAKPESLTDDQIRYAAEDAYFTYMVWQQMSEMPDIASGQDACDQGILQIKEGWAEQGIDRRHDGLYCKVCSQGPMTVPMVVESHIGGKKHRKNMEDRAAVPSTTWEIPDEWTMQGMRGHLVATSGMNFRLPDGTGLKQNEYWCTFCRVKVAQANMKAHIDSKKHHKCIAGAGDADDGVDLCAKGREQLDELLWNLPDYVEVKDQGRLYCQICGCRADGVQQMFQHLGGTTHQKNLRRVGKDELLYVEAKNQLMDFRTGTVIVRAGHKAHSAKKKASAATPAAAAVPSQELQLPPGWEEHWSAENERHFYHNPALQITQWDKPEAEQDVPAAAAATHEAAQCAAATETATTEAATTEAATTEVSAQCAAADDCAGAPTGAEGAATGELPPGWTRVEAGDGSVYYADLETNTSSWEPPPPWVPGLWSRHVHTDGEGFWAGENGEAFWENGDPSWECLEDNYQRKYWSNKTTGVRFLLEP